MTQTFRGLSPSQAARRLGVSAKALRLYERYGLISPDRTPSGWRTYGRAELERATEIASLRALGLSLAQVGQAIGCATVALDAMLAAQEARLHAQAAQTADMLKRVQRFRSGMTHGGAPRPEGPFAAFALPWPWGGETFELRDLKPLNYVTGPLGSGKTRLARLIAETLPDGLFLGLDRLADPSGLRARLDSDPCLNMRVEEALARLVERGARRTDALTALLAALESEHPASLVIDMVEQDLDERSQRALIAWLRASKSPKGALFLMTRSSSILDLATLGQDECVIFCPANHSPPMIVDHPGAAGYEAVATCLAAPDVRARTAGVVAVRAHAA